MPVTDVAIDGGVAEIPEPQIELVDGGHRAGHLIRVDGGASGPRGDRRPGVGEDQVRAAAKPRALFVSPAVAK